MRNKISYILFVISLSITSYSQNFEWAKSFGAYSEDFASDICTDSLGYIYLAGHYDEDVDVDPGPGETMIYAVVRRIQTIFTCRRIYMGENICNIGLSGCE